MMQKFRKKTCFRILKHFGAYKFTLRIWEGCCKWIHKKIEDSFGWKDKVFRWSRRNLCLRGEKWLNISGECILDLEKWGNHALVQHFMLAQCNVSMNRVHLIQIILSYSKSFKLIKTCNMSIWTCQMHDNKRASKAEHHQCTHVACEQQGWWGSTKRTLSIETHPYTEIRLHNYGISI